MVQPLGQKVGAQVFPGQTSQGPQAICGGSGPEDRDANVRLPVGFTLSECRSSRTGAAQINNQKTINLAAYGA
jgi:hypothetical protein